MTKNRWLTASLFIHLTCLIILISRFQGQAPTDPTTLAAIDSYLTNLPAEVNTTGIEPRHTAPKRPASHTAAHTTPSNRPASELAALLHAAIEQAQHYPASAEEMEREGRTTLAFTLFRNGTISNLKIARSSGTKSLDYAALAAVNEAVPFQQVDRYLKEAQNYQVDVVFKLH